MGGRIERRGNESIYPLSPTLMYCLRGEVKSVRTRRTTNNGRSPRPTLNRKSYWFVDIGCRCGKGGRREWKGEVGAVEEVLPVRGGVMTSRVGVSDGRVGVV